MSKTKKLTLLSMMVSMSLVLYRVEFFLPSLDFIAPGVKLGLPNIISISCLYIFGVKEAFAVLTVRSVISSMMFSGVTAMMYSLVGGVLSLIFMWILKKVNFKSVSIIGVSMIGSFSFNIGQLTVASLILQNFKVFYYLPYVSFMSMLTGIFVGLTAIFLIKAIKRVMKYEHVNTH